MILSLGKLLILLMCVYTLCDDFQRIHKEQASIGGVCGDDDENGHCDTVGTDSMENSTEFSNFSNIEGESTINSTSTLDMENGNTSTEFPETTTISSPATSTVSAISGVKTTTEPSFDMHFIPEDVCSCDLTVDYCDINCCCDEDCSAGDRQAFSHCFKRSPISPDPRYCYQTNFIYRNNTEYKMVQNREGLFCILWDNLPSEIRYVKKKVVTNLQDFKKLYKRRRIHQWPAPISSGPIFQPMVYRAGNIVWSISNTTIAPFALPNTLVSAFCETSMPVRYLINWSGSCSSMNFECSNKSALSATSYYGTFHLIASPQLMNHSQITYFLEQQECLYNVCLPFNLFICTLGMFDTEDCLPVDDIEVPIFNNETNVCSNVVKMLKYRIYHNGTSGIARAEAYFWMIDVMSMQTHKTHLSQTFSVDFVWIDSPKRPFCRSGNPGYIVGKPVIAGQKVFRISESEQDADKDAILLSEDQSKWLTFPRAELDGVCVSNVAESSRISINFGENLLSSCFLEFFITNFSSPENCSSVQRHILETLLGDAMINVTEPKQFNLYVSTFGDANVEETADWVVVLLENMPIVSVGWKQEVASLICKDIVTDLHINIVTSKIGLATRPQSKILGVSVSFSGGRDLTFDCSPSPCSSFDANKKQRFEIKSSVSFLDVSKAPVVHFAEPPVYEVKLPYDFFYPFLSSYSPRPIVCRFLVVLSLIVSSFFVVSL